MNTASLIRLLTLGAIWGSSFAFMRATAPTFGPPLLIELRVAIAAAFLTVVGLWLGKRIDWKKDWRYFLWIGFINTALPFTLFAYAALTLPASLLAIFNSLAPLFGALIGAIWFGTRITRTAALGLALGVIGVTGLTYESIAHATLRGGPMQAVLAVLAGAGASLCYGLAANWIRARKENVDAFATAQGTLWGASMLMLLTFPTWPLPVTATTPQWLAVAVLGFMCTGAAYLLHFRLIADLGASRALTVTFLIPVFGVLWGILFLDEQIGPGLIIGGPLILIGTALANGLTLKALRSG